MSITTLTAHSIALIQDLCRGDATITCAFSGAEDIVVLDLIHRSKLNVPVFALDTGRLHAETRAYILEVQRHFDLDFTWVAPKPNAVTAFEQRVGRFSFYIDGHQECCHLRKTAPLRRHLANFDGWLTGLRRDQSSSRNALADVQTDPIFQGLHGPLQKGNPLANWSRLEVETYIKQCNLPVNPLVHQGYASIGCEPCTRAIQAHEHERAGRWWWENSTSKECGLHEQPVTLINSV